MSEPWPVQELGAVGVHVLDCEHKTPKPAERGYPYVAIPNLVDGRLRLEDARRISPEDFSRWTRRIAPKPGDIIVTRRARVGDSAVIPEGVQCAIGQNLVILRSTGQWIDQAYLRWAVRGPQWKSEVDRLRNVGAVFDSLNVSDIPRIKIPYPPMRSQRTIAAFLNALDDKMCVNDGISKTSLQLALARYRAISEDESWPSICLRDAAQWLSGGTPRTSEASYWDGDIPWISALSLKSPWIVDSDRKVTQLGVANGTRLVAKNAVIFIVRGSSLDAEFRIGLTQREVAFSQDCKALIAADGVDPAILFLAIRSHETDILRLVDHAGHGAGRLSTDLIANISVRLPSGSRKQVVCDHLVNLVDVGAIYQAENRALAALRDTLLPKLMHGEIRVREAKRIVEDAT